MEYCVAAGSRRDASLVAIPGAVRATTRCRMTIRMNIRSTDILRAIAYPVTESSVLVPLIVFWLLVSIGMWGGVFGRILLFLIVVPAVFRFQMIVLEARARATTPATPDTGFFNWFGKAWTLFPSVSALLLIFTTVVTGLKFGTAWASLPVLIGSVFFPASIAVLAITHSPLQSLNVVALARLWNKCRSTFWLATIYLIVASWLAFEATTLAFFWASLSWLLLSFAFFSLVGSLIEPYSLIEDIYIPAPLEKDETAAAQDLDRARTEALNHAYGFISRGNREGGFDHLFDWIQQDPDPVAAWDWFFARMMRWESQRPALFFAQHHIHDHLRHGEQVPAVKLIMHCRLIDDRFRPFHEDLPAAIAACDACDNPELATILKQN